MCARKCPYCDFYSVTDLSHEDAFYKAALKEVELIASVIDENADKLIDIGYPAIGHYKARWAEEISRFMKPENNISPSFKNFKMALVTALKNPVPIYRKRSF